MSVSASPQRRRDQLAAFAPEQGQIRQAVDADDLDAQLAPVDEGRATAAPGSGDDVSGGEQESVRGEHERAARAGGQLAAAAAAHDPEIGHRRRQPLGDGDDDAGIGIERLLLGLGAGV